MLDLRTQLHCLLRTWLLGAAVTACGMQHLGLAYTLEPALRQLYPDPGRCAAARRRHLESINTHPFMAPLLSGIILYMEEQIIAGTLPEKTAGQLKATIATSLSAIGDSVFNGSILVSWALYASLLLLLGSMGAVIAGTLFLFALQLVFRISSFFLGLHMGPAALIRLRALDLINWGDRLKIVNAVLLAILLHCMVPATLLEQPEQLLFWGCAIAGGLIPLLMRPPLPRLALAGFLVVLLLAGEYFSHPDCYF